MLTQVAINAAQPKAKPYKLADGRGLFLLIETNGSKVWRFRYKLRGRENMLSLGVFPSVTLAQARVKRDAVLWVAVDAKGRKFVVDELYTADYFNGAWKPYRLTNAALVQRIRAKSEGFRIEERIGDPSMFNQDKHQDDPAGMTLAAKLSELGLDYAPATKDRSTADKVVGDALNFEKVGDEIVRAPELYVFDTCVRTIWEIEHYQWEDWRGKAAERKSPRERPMDKDDHEIECLGRILVRQPSFRPMPAPRDAHSDTTQGQQTQDFEVY